MKKLTEEQIEKRDAAIDTITAQIDAFSDLVSAGSQDKAKLRAPLEAILLATDALEVCLTEIAEEMSEYYNAQDRDWVDSDEGGEFADWMNDYDEFDVTELEGEVIAALKAIKRGEPVEEIVLDLDFDALLDAPEPGDT